MKTIKIQRSELSKFTNTPVFAYCRKLIQDGEDPSARLEVFGANIPEYDICITNIGEGAKLSIKECPLHLVPYQEVRMPKKG